MDVVYFSERERGAYDKHLVCLVAVGVYLLTLSLALMYKFCLDFIYLFIYLCVCACPFALCYCLLSLWPSKIVLIFSLKSSRIVWFAMNSIPCDTWLDTWLHSQTYKIIPYTRYILSPCHIRVGTLCRIHRWECPYVRGGWSVLM